MALVDEIRKEAIEDDPKIKTLLDFIDDRIDQRVEAILSDARYVVQDDIAEALSVHIKVAFD